jgi:hypothetical protein
MPSAPLGAIAAWTPSAVTFFFAVDNVKEHKNRQNDDDQEGQGEAVVHGVSGLCGLISSSPHLAHLFDGLPAVAN